MRTHPTLTSILALGMFGLCALGARQASAETTCSKDSDCVKGWTCEVTGGSGCGYACAPGQDCPPPVDCVTTEIKSCRPGPCKADSDCESGMVCYTQSETSCPPTACDSKGPCPQVECTVETKSACVPRYLLPCKTAADCGAGFSCVAAQEDCSCSGSAPSSDSGAGNAAGALPVPEPGPDCTCAPSTTSVCLALPVDCTTAADCAAGWSCDEVGGTDCVTQPAPAPEPGGAPGGTAGSGSKPLPDSDPCQPSPSVKQCRPPYYGEAGVSRDDGASTATLGTGGASSNGGKGAAPEAAAGKSPTESSAGCAVALGSRAGGGAAGLFALGLFGLLRRRRLLHAAR